MDTLYLHKRLYNTFTLKRNGGVILKDKLKPPLILTQEQRAFIESLLIENEAVIKYTIKKALGEQYGYLFEDCVGNLCLLMCEKIAVLEAHPNPAAWVIVSAKFTAFTEINNNKNHANTVQLEEAKLIVRDTTFEEVLYSIWLKNSTAEKLAGTLTKREIQVYRKLCVENKDIATTAKELGITPSAVRTFKQTIKDKILERI